MAKFDFYFSGHVGWQQILIIAIALWWLFAYIKTTKVKKNNNTHTKTTINNVTIINTYTKENNKINENPDDKEYTDYEELK